jgi:hypothetical protein
MMLLFFMERVMSDFMNQNKSTLAKDYQSIIYTYIYFTSNYLGKIGAPYIRLKDFIDFELDQGSRDIKGETGTVPLYPIMLLNSLQKIIVRNQASSEISFMSMKNNIVRSATDDGQVCYREC